MSKILTNSLEEFMLSEFFQLLENKNRFIDANPNLTDEQKEELKKFFLKYPQYESKMGDWQKSKTWTWETFEPIIAFSKKNNFEKALSNIEGLRAGLDYRVIYVSDKISAYQPLSHKGAWVLASNAVGPAVWTRLPGWYPLGNEGKDYTRSPIDENLWSGAKWCISMRHTSKYWDDYTGDRNCLFLFVMSSDENIVPSKKIAFTFYPSRNGLDMFTADDNNIAQHSNPEKSLKNYPEMKKAFDKWMYKLNPGGMEYIEELIQAGLVVQNKEYYNFKNSEKVKYNRLLDETGNLPIKIGFWGGDWICLDMEMFKNSPREVKGNYSCKALELGSLEGCPEKVHGDFDCSRNNLTSLKGLPLLKPSSTLNCSENKLETLEGCAKLLASIDCSKNKLTSLKGISEVIFKKLDCAWNELESLEGPRVVDILYANHNIINSLKGMPLVKKMLDIRDNDITSDEGLNLAPTASVLL